MPYPELPGEILAPNIDLEEIWKEVCEELTQEKFKNRSHMNRRTHSEGCRGPLCKKANRDFKRRRQQWKARAIYVELDQVLDFFFVIAKEQIAQHQADILDKLIS
jgi:hypothetical protein